ncbi:uncharacterized protein METZ01_LOCUS193579 [marine metagenome]|uniref:DUF998 domain-containing protein n=1 Tax=marine metagenome TaxID=408172 RepID=A0A382DR80_9ZZZZ
MDKIAKVKSISIWVFIIPFIALNACLILITQFHGLFPNQEHIIHNTIPYIDGQVSISRTARVFPTYLIFKPAMFLTSYLLIKYWLYTKEIILFFNKNNKNIKYIMFFGIGSAILLILHSVFLGIKFDNELYKLFRKAVMLFFIIFEIVAQAYLVMTYYSFKNHLLKFINQNFLKMKLMLVLILVLVALISIPIVTMPGNKFLKHALEWDYFMGIISFYLLTFFMWKNKNE